MNTRENFWNVFCFGTNQMWEETVKGSLQTATAWKVWISQDLTWNNALAFFFQGKVSILPFSNTEIVLVFLFQLMYKQRIDMTNILRKSNVESSRQDHTQLDIMSESRKFVFYQFLFGIYIVVNYKPGNYFWDLALFPVWTESEKTVLHSFCL